MAASLYAPPFHGAPTSRTHCSNPRSPWLAAAVHHSSSGVAPMAIAHLALLTDDAAHVFQRTALWVNVAVSYMNLGSNLARAVHMSRNLVQVKAVGRRSYAGIHDTTARSVSSSSLHIYFFFCNTLTHSPKKCCWWEWGFSHDVKGEDLYSKDEKEISIFVYQHCTSLTRSSMLRFSRTLRIVASMVLTVFAASLSVRSRSGMSTRSSPSS